MADNRGGKRPGAGRKPTPGVSDRQVKAMLRVAAKLKRETGVSIDEILVRLIYSGKSKVMEKLAAIRLFKDYTMARTSQVNMDVVKHETGPGIYLPEEQPDPATPDALAPASRPADRVLQ